MNLPNLSRISNAPNGAPLFANQGLPVMTENSRTESRQTPLFYPGNSKAFLAANSRKARVVTFYRNGRQFEHGVRLSFVVGKTFPHLDSLMDFLTDKCSDIAYGVRYIFTLTGRMVLHLDELQHNMCYVMSGVKQFHFLDYGVTEREWILKNSESSTSVISYSGSDGPSFGHLLGRRYANAGYYRSADNITNGQIFNSDTSNYTSSLNSTSNSSQSTGVLNNLTKRKVEAKHMTLVNTANPSIKTKVLLNLRSPKSFEGILKDLGDAVKMTNPRKLFTETGHEVRGLTCIQLLYFLSTYISFMVVIESIITSF